MSHGPWAPTLRAIHDADELERLAARLRGLDRDALALEYFRLSARLETLAKDAREFAEIMAGPVP
jgi:hypothetical protein